MRLSFAALFIAAGLLMWSGCSDSGAGSDCEDPSRCDDGNPCTDDSCDPDTGCHHTTASCDDGDACTEDSCDPETGCTYPAISCDDQDACTEDSCDPETGCAHPAISCDDEDACTADSCDPAAGCVNQALSCDDQDACTTDSCDPVDGCLTTAISCDDQDTCTVDACDPVDGCVNTAISCDDQDACTEDSCDPSTGCVNTDITCDDGDVCTDDLCDPATGCFYEPVVCDDADPCTDEACLDGIGCQVIAVSCADLRADVNRDGVVDPTDPTDDLNEDTWDATHGAVFLANIDDDQETCSDAGSDSSLAACHDAADSVVNGSSDALDLARLLIPAWAGAPDGASASVWVDGIAPPFVRLFKIHGPGSYSLYNPGDTIPAAELRAGVELGIEALDFVRDDTEWDGFADLTLEYVTGLSPGTNVTDTVRLRVSPVLFHHGLESVHTAYVTNVNWSGNAVFRNDFETARIAAGVPNIWNIYENDQWTGDFFKTAYMSMPAPGGQHVIHVNFRSANWTGSGPLREAGRTVYTTLRGPDIAGAVQYDPNHTDFMDTLNSFTNLLVIPPHGDWPLGRVLRGGGDPSWHPDASFDLMVQSQGMQDIVYVDTSWLLVGHVAETINFIEHPSGTHGWLMLVADPDLCKTMLEQYQANGYGNTSMFVGKYWQGGAPAEMTINEVLADPDIMTESAFAAANIASQVDAIKSATGITDADIIPLPALFWQAYGHSVDFIPSLVNGLVLTDTDYVTANPHGPVINGQDIFKVHMQQALGALGVAVYYVENWDLYHRLNGGVRAGSNATREIPTSSAWWESGL